MPCIDNSRPCRSDKGAASATFRESSQFVGWGYVRFPTSRGSALEHGAPIVYIQSIFDSNHDGGEVAWLSISKTRR
jgi:hypothetical protein